MPMCNKILFSPDGEFCASIIDNVSLKIWETIKNSLKFEHNFKSRVNQTCSALTWGARSIGTNKNGKTSSPVLVIGLQKGNILLYDLQEEDLCENFISGHSDEVTDIQYDHHTNTIYSCSKDCFIIAWNALKGKIKLKWKVDDAPSSLCVMDKNNLLSSGKEILWWDIENQTIIKKFNGHKTSVIMLQSVFAVSSSNFYFLSIAKDEKLVYAWHLAPQNNKSAVATFKLEHSPENIDVTKSYSKEKPMMVSAITETGELVLFEHALNGRIKRNLSAKMTLQIMSKSSKSSDPNLIPILSSKFLPDQTFCVIAYGTVANPVFEKVNVTSAKTNVILLRERPSKNIISTSPENLVSKLNGQEPTLSESFSSPKRIKKDSENSSNLKRNNRNILDKRQSVAKSTDLEMNILIEKELSAEAIQISSTLTNPSDIVNTLLKSFEISDEQLLHTVLNCNDKELIKNSVKFLPCHSLEKIMQALYHRLFSCDNRTISSTRTWILEILNIHLTYLSTCEETSDIVSQIQNKINERRVADTLSKLLSLKGLLNILKLKSNPSELSSDNDTDEDMCL